MTRSKTARAGSANQSGACSCVVCSKDVVNGSKAVECDLCCCWVHVQCPGDPMANISKAVYDAILENQGANTGLLYFCPKCRHLSGKVISVFKNYEQFREEVADQFGAMQTQIDQLIKAKNNTPVVPSTPIPNIQEEIQEALEKERKKLNVVLVGVPEVDTSSLRNNGDKAHVVDICNALGVAPSEVVDVFRDGKVVDKVDERGRQHVRIMKVKFLSKDSKMTFLRGYRGQRDVSIHSYARHDLTYRQRMVDKALRGQLEANRSADPSRFFYIRGGRIMSRPRDAHETNTYVVMPETASQQLTYGQPPSQ